MMEYYFEIEHDKKKISGQGNFASKKDLVFWLRHKYIGCKIRVLMYLNDIKKL